MVKYGANGQFILTGASNGMPCGLWYGSDPAPGQAKHCFYSASNGTQAVGPPGYTYCAPQGGTCDFSGPGTIVYGYAGAFTTPIQTVGPVGCGDNFGDPAPGTVKACFYSTGTSVTRTEIYAGSRHLATYDGGSTYFVHTDWLGTERARTDFQGNLCQTTATLPYGDLISLPPAGPALSSNCAPSDNLFTGKERDTESGLDYFGARYYGSSMGRFMSPDWSENAEAIPYASYADPQSLNLYSYVLNNPLRHRDRDGHSCDPNTWNSKTNTVTAGACHLDWWDLPGHAFVGLGNIMTGHTWTGVKQMAYGYGQGLMMMTGVGEGEGLLELGLEAPDAAATVRGGLGPVLQGAAGVAKATAEIEAEGGSVVATEVTIENSAGRARVDLVYKDANGELQFGEAKNGPTAKLNANQTRVYERMKSEGAKVVGGNASKAGLPSNAGATAVRLFKY